MSDDITKTSKITEPYTYRIPSKYYESDYRLVDVQYINKYGQLIFIFRDKNNKKIFYTPAKKDIEYYWYEGSSNKLIEKVEDTELKIDKFSNRELNGRVYESDVHIANKHALDYYLRNKEEADVIKYNILYYDIEVYTGKDLSFPEPELAKHPINAISFKLDDNEVEMYLLIHKDIDEKWKELKNDEKFENVKYFNDERKLLSAFINRLHELSPDFICGWNSGRFDDPYVINRMYKLDMKAADLSPFKSVYSNPVKSSSLIYGYVPLDQMVLYKELTYTNESSYSLENICQKELKKGKKQYDGDLNSLYTDDIFTFCEYSITDTELLYELEQEVGHIALMNELRIAATTSHKGASSTIGQADGLINYELKKSNIVMKNGTHTPADEKLPGAYVKQPIGGIYDWVIDFDYTSLYPSIMISYNIGPNTYLAKIPSEDAHMYTYNIEQFKKKKYIEFIPSPIYNDKVSKISVNRFLDIIKKYNAIISPLGTIFKGHNVEKTILYPIIKKLFTQRKYYKKLMIEAINNGNDFESKKNNSKQMAYKILLNSLYGVLGQEHFRFFNLDLAATITVSGRHLIKFAGEHVDQWMGKVSKNGICDIDINPNYMNDCEETKPYLKYVDTDSLFLHMQPFLNRLNVDINVDNIQNWTNKIHDFLNNELLVKYAEMSNIDKSESMLDIKSELICKRYYTLNVKKKYALHIINKEGANVDKIDIKGLEINRSDISEDTKVMLSKLVDNILKNEDFSYDLAMSIVNEFTNKAINSINNREVTFFNSVSFSKPLEQYKAIPQHLKGMQIWNDLEYDHFRYGNRGILVNLKAIDLDSAPSHVVNNYYNKFLKKWNVKDLDVIVIPETYEYIPNYYIIDVQEILRKAINDRYEILLEPIAKKSSVMLF